MGGWVWVVVGVVVVPPVVLAILGARRPARHVASVRALFPGVPAEVLWTAVSSIRGWPEWNPDIRKVEPGPDQDGDPVFLVTARWGRMPFRVVLHDEPRMVVQTGESGRSFSGSWSFEIEKREPGSALLLTEAGEVKNPLIRGLMFLHDEHETMRRFAEALAKHLKVEVSPEPVRPDSAAK